jgi:uncharacterized protein YdhG (YjbR/CyaY superfamily)
VDAMTMSAKVPKDFNGYAAQFPKEVQGVLRRVRLVIKRAAPKARESISYRIPAFLVRGRGVYYAAFAHHIGFYPGASPIRKFRKDLRAYHTAKGSVRFPLDKPLPLGLIGRIARFRMRQAPPKKT